MPVQSILRNRHCNGNTNRTGRRNLHCACRRFDHSCNRCNQSGDQYSGHIPLPIHFSGTCSNTTTASITINALPTATISYAGSPYCATGTATVTQTGQAGGIYTAPAGVSMQQRVTSILQPAHQEPTRSPIRSATELAATRQQLQYHQCLPTATISYTGTPYCATGTATVTQTGPAGGTYTAPAGV